jgi:drug/metabolite transporter (DMT)-like permease
MIYLLLAILFTSSLFLLFRWYSDLMLNIFQTIVWNYVVCSITGYVVQIDSLTEAIYAKHTDTLIAATLLGSCFLPVFFLMGTSTRLAGITPTTMANKLSMIIPAGFAILVGLAPFTWMQILAIILGVISIYIVTQKTNTTSETTTFNLLPWLVFISGGLLDLGILYINKNIVTAESGGLFSVHVFVAAAVVGMISLSTAIIFKKDTFQWKSILSGILLGIPNYFSIYFLLKSLDHFKNDGSFVFPSMNLSIIIFTAIVSFVLFKEKLTARIGIGLVVATCSILLLYLNQPAS